VISRDSRVCLPRTSPRLPTVEDGRARGGNRLGPVGGRIVGDVLIGLLDRDPLSYRRVDPAWRPEYPTLAALLEFGAARSTAVR
jgi:hypothetical protein